MQTAHNMWVRTVSFNLRILNAASPVHRHFVSVRYPRVRGALFCSHRVACSVAWTACLNVRIPTTGCLGNNYLSLSELRVKPFSDILRFTALFNSPRSYMHRTQLRRYLLCLIRQLWSPWSFRWYIYPLGTHYGHVIVHFWRCSIDTSNPRSNSARYRCRALRYTALL